MSVKRRNSSVVLDPIKVRSYAKSCGIKSKNDLQDHYNNIFEGTGRGADGTPEKAWNGVRLRRQFAQTIAELFGLSSYIPLLADQGLTVWSRLIHDDNLQGSFMRLHLASEAGSPLFDFSKFQACDKNEIDRININEDWYLSLQGKEGSSVMIIFQSAGEFFQLAPLNHADFRNIILERQALRYPLKGYIPFDKRFGEGWRRFIAIKANYIPLAAKSEDTGYRILPIELEQFALRLEQDSQNQVCIDHYEFEITTGSTQRLVV